MRKQLLASRLNYNSPRNFQFNEVYFVWSQVCDLLYTRELERKQQGTTGKTRMTYSVAHPDHFSKMSTHFSKIPFELDSILEQVHHLAKLIGREEQELLLDHMRNTKDGTALTPTYRFSVQFLKNQLQSDEFKSMDVLVQRLANAIMNNIEYSVSVRVIFFKIFMNKNMQYL
jgi:hypothetical protein